MRMPKSAILCLGLFGWFAGSAFGQQALSWRDLVSRFEKAVGDVAVEVAEDGPTRPVGLFVPSAADAAAAPPSKWFPLESIEHAPARLVVLVHGLDEPGDIWTDLAPAIVAGGDEIARFEYPNDQPVYPSAALFIQHLKAARSAGVEEISIVAHSMGGLVAFDALTRADGYNGDMSGGGTLPRVTRLITVGTPWAGSPWNRLQAVSELREQVQRWAEGESWDLRPLLRDAGDVKGRAGEDLGEKSKLVTELEARPTPRGLELTIIAGRIVAPNAADWSWVEESAVLRRVLGREAVEQLVSDIESVGGTLGDGVVPLESALARASDDAVVFEANHRGLIRNTPIDFATGAGTKGPPAIPLILERLGLAWPPPPAAEDQPE